VVHRRRLRSKLKVHDALREVKNLELTELLEEVVVEEDSPRVLS